MRVTRNKNFKRFMISYMLVMLIPLAITAYVYTRSTNIMERNAIEANLFKLNNFNDVLDGRIERIDKYVHELNQNDKLAKIINLPNRDQNTPDMYWFEDFYKYFNDFSFYSSLDLNRCFLFLNQSNAVFGNFYLNFNRTEFYEDYFKFVDLSYEEWQDLFFEKYYYAQFLPAREVTINNITNRYIPYLYSLPVMKSDNSNMSRMKGTVSYLLNVDNINELLSDSLREDGGKTYILGDNNHILASTDNTSKEYLELPLVMDEPSGTSKITIDGKQMLAMYVRSSYSALSYLTVLPLDSIRSDMYQLRDIVGLVVGIAILAGLSVSAFLSYKNTVPILNLLSANSRLREDLELQHHSIQILYIDKLLKNDFTAMDDMELTLKHVGLELEAGSCRVILVRILPSNDMLSDAILQEKDVYRVLINNLLRPQDIVHILNHNELAIIVASGSDEDINQIASHIQTEFNRQFGFMPLFFVGEACAHPFEIHHSLREAQFAADYANMRETSGNMVWYRDIEMQNTFGLFGKDREQALYNLIRQGKRLELDNYLQNMYQSDEYHTMPAAMKQLFLSHLHTLLIRFSDESKVTISFKEFEKIDMTKRQSYFTAVKNAYMQLCSSLDSGKKSHNHKLRENILAYIQENYKNCDLSVTMLAGQFNLAESYFSQFFREQMGDTFSHYLENLRISQACKLLADGSLSVDEIAQNLGYNTANTFRRAFKRVTGMTPSSYS